MTVTRPCRVMLIAGAAVAFGLILAATTGHYGFNPTDEGLVQAYASRMAMGQVPHADFISPRPVGSSVLHFLSLAVPGPWMLAERYAAAIQIAIASVCLGALAVASVGHRINAAALIAFGAAAAVNLHTFPLMAWYTIDGLVLVSISFCLLILGSPGNRLQRITVAFLLLGTAAVTKQSFAPAVLLGLLAILLTGSQADRPRIAREVALAAGAAAVAPMAYVAIVAAGGGLSDLWVQATSGQRGFLAAPLTSLSDMARFAALAVGSTFVVVTQLAKAGSAGRSPLLDATRITGPYAVAATVLLFVLPPYGLLYDQPWGWLLFWLAAVSSVTRSVLRRKPDLSGIVIVSLAWMVSLSWGAPYPNLAAGSLAFLVIAHAFEGSEIRGRWRTAATSLAALVSVGVVVIVLVARLNVVYRDRPASELIASLDRVSPALAGLVTNEVTRAFLEQVRDCVHLHPASRVAILPDGAAIYPIFGLRAALPIDWLWPPDYVNSEHRILVAAARVRAEGDALVMWQTVDASRMAELDDLPDAQPGTTPFDHDPLFGSLLRTTLGGMEGTCGSFLIWYWPPMDSEGLPTVDGTGARARLERHGRVADVRTPGALHVAQAHPRHVLLWQGHRTAD